MTRKACQSEKARDLAHQRIAIIGARGLGNYGGFETVVGELAPRLARKGHKIFCSHEFVSNQIAHDSSIGIMYFPFRFPNAYSLRKVLEIFYDWYFLIRCLLVVKCHVILCLGTGVGPALFLAKASRAKTIVNVDGVEWNRAKFGFAERGLIKILFALTYIAANRIIIDNRSMETFIPPAFRRKHVHIAYGVVPPIRQKWDSSEINSHIDCDQSISPGEYWLVVARLEPDNSIQTIVRGYAQSDSCSPLVLVGAFTSPVYRDTITQIASELPREKRVILAGPIYNQRILSMLRLHCRGYIHGHSVGGTNPSLLEAMAAMNIIVAHDNPFNREVCLEDALYFHDCESLAHCIDLAESDKASFADSKKRILKRVGEVYSWERIADEYDRLFRATVAGNSAQSVDEEPVRGTSPNSPPHRYWGRKR